MLILEIFIIVPDLRVRYPQSPHEVPIRLSHPIKHPTYRGQGLVMIRFVYILSAPVVLG